MLSILKIEKSLKRQSNKADNVATICFCRYEHWSIIIPIESISSFQYQNSDISFLLYISAIFIAGTNSKPQNWDWTSGSYYGASQDYGWGGNDVSSYSNSVPSYSAGQWSQYQPGEDWNTQQAPTCKKLT